MPINSRFFEKSKEIANAYLQSIVFIDDKAYAGLSNDNPNHDFDAQKVSMAFAKEQKICAIYSPKSEQDIHNIKLIVKKADIIILDWQIILQNTNIGNPDADAETEDPRGKYTLQIIKDIVQDSDINKNALKLIIVYTGETNLEDISANIQREINTNNGIEKFELESCKLFSKNIKILIRAKSSVNDGETDTKFNHIPSLKDKIVKYEDLPSFILKEFTLMTSGLLSNFALLSLTTIRNNSHKLLGLFSKDLDSAYLSHKSLIPNSEDAEDLLLDILKDSIADLLSYNQTNKIINKDLIENWLDINIVEQNHPILNSKGKQLNPIKTFSRKKSTLNDLLFSNETDVEKKILNIFKTLIHDKGQREDYLKYLSVNNTKLFLNIEDEPQEEEINKKFAKLTHHKSIFIPINFPPRLNLGTIVKSTNNIENYFICIQQKCDCVRIYGTERKFLFLPLKIVEDNGKFDIISPDGVKLKLDKKTFSVRTIKFTGDKNDGVVKAVRNNSDIYIFQQKYKDITDEHFEWVLDLKDLHAQRIVTEYASQLSRVGLDESEWLRRWGR